jgi:drug/metabolite transporter (DMT)-like permease
MTVERIAKARRRDWQGRTTWATTAPDPHLSQPMTAALLALAAATALGCGHVLTQFGLRHVHPLSGAAISIPTFSLVFLAASPFLLQGDAINWRAVPIFAAVGLVFPALLTILTFASNRALGPVVTGALGNLAPLFSVLLAVVILNEPLGALQLLGLVVIVSGVVFINVSRTHEFGNWRTWALLLPLSATAMRGVIPPVIKIGLEIWPNPLAAALTGYIFSTLTVMTLERVRNGRFIVAASWRGWFWFGLNGIFNGVGTLLLYAALGAGPVTLVAPLYASSPIITLIAAAIVLRQFRVSARLAVGTVLTVAGVVLILVG